MFGTLVSASQTAPASGPVRPVCSFPSPAPYDTGFETPCAQRMSSASQAASTSARRPETMSPSPVPSYALSPIVPMSEGGGGSPFMSLGSPTPSAPSEGWHRPEQYAGALRTDAAWLNKFQSAVSESCLRQTNSTLQTAWAALFRLPLTLVFSNGLLRSWSWSWGNS
jgi:hypothetical protein